MEYKAEGETLRKSSE